jgi:MFS family permease
MTILGILTSGRFAPYFTAQFLGAFNDNLLKNALVILISYKNLTVLGIAPAQMVALAGGIFILPFFLFSAVSGQLADRHAKHRVLRWVKMAELGIAIVAAIGFVGDTPEIALVALFLMGLHSAVFGPVKYSILPEIVPSQSLLSANGLVEAGTFLAILLGTILGSLLIGQTQNGGEIVSILMLTAAVIGIVAAMKIPVLSPADTSIRIRNPLGPLLRLLGFFFRNRAMRSTLTAISWFWAFGSVFLSVFPTLVKNVLHAESGMVTLFLTAFSVGIGIGSMACARLKKTEFGAYMTSGSAIAMSALTLDFALTCSDWSVAGPVTVVAFLSTISGWRIFADLIGVSLAAGVFIVPLYTYMQESSDPRQRSQVIAICNVINAAFMVAAAAVLLILFRFGWSEPAALMLLAAANLSVAACVRFPKT